MLEQRFDVPDGVQALEALGIVTSGDYAEVFEPLIDGVRRAGRRLRLLYQFGPGFERFTAGAQYHRVDACPTRVCNAERDAAANWLAALPEGQRPSNLQMARTYIGGTGGAVASIGRLALARAPRSRRR